MNELSATFVRLHVTWNRVGQGKGGGGVARVIM